QENELKFDFEQRVLLVPSVSWVQVPNALYVSSIGNTFTARVDPTQLEPGRLHTAAIDAYDSGCVDRGPIFSVPITVTKPLTVDASACVELGTIRFRPADIARHFIGVPAGATCAEITMEADNSISQAVAPSLIYLHCLQLAPESRFRKHWLLQRVSIGHKTFGSGGSTSPTKHRSVMPVAGGVTLEVCLAQYWNQLDMHDVKVTVKFNGLVPVSSGGSAFANTSSVLEPGLMLNGNHLVARTEVMSLVRPEYFVKPSASLDRFQRALRPNKATIFPLSAERDTHLLTGTAIQCLELEYRLDTSKDKTYVRFFMPAVDTQIYEAWADNFALSVFDANKRRVATQINYTSSLELPRQGEYLIRAHIRHRSAKDLEALKDAPLLIEFTLASSITLPVEYSLASVFTNTVDSSTYRGGFLPKGGRAALFFNLSKKMPSEVAPGDILRGSLTLNNVTAKLRLEMIVPAKIKSTEEPEKSLVPENHDESPAAREQRELEEELRRVRLSWVGKAKEASVRDALVAELTSSSSDNEQRAEALAAHLKALDAAPSSLPWTEAAHLAEAGHAQRILELAGELSELVRPLALTARLYESAESDEEKREKKRAEQARSHMQAALQSRCRALAALTTFTSCSASASEDSAEFVHVDSSNADVSAHLRDYEKAAAEMR
ncbi:hypothetical protein IWW36_005216, partial [Coemansia brasiliensis]